MWPIIGPPQNDTVHTLQNTGYKKRLLQPPTSPKIGVLEIGFLKDKNIDVNQKTQFKIRKTQRLKEGFERQNKTGNQKNRKD